MAKVSPLHGRRCCLNREFPLWGENPIYLHIKRINAPWFQRNRGTREFMNFSPCVLRQLKCFIDLDETFYQEIVLHIHSGVHEIYVFLIQFFPQQLDGFTEPLEMHNFPFPQEFDDIVHIRVVGKPENVVICHPGLLL